MNREIKTVMHEIKKRHATVLRTELLSPSIKKITFNGSDFKDFTSLSPDDHVKVFFQDGSMRDYTPYEYNNSTNEISICFFLHGNGVASQWASNAKIGDNIIIAGPKGSRIVPYAYDGYLLIGDETSLGSFKRRLKEMPKDAKAVVIIEVENEANIVEMRSSENQEIHFVFRDTGLSQYENLLAKINSLKLPTGDFFTWISCEKSTSRLLREEVIKNKSFKESQIKSTGYWS